MKFSASLGGCGLRYWPGNSNKGVVLFPDYVIYQDKYYLGLKLTFSESHIQINHSIPFGNHEAINIELAVDNVIDIKSQLFQSVSLKVVWALLTIYVLYINFAFAEVYFIQNRTVMMKLCVRSSNTSHISCTSGRYIWYGWLILNGFLHHCMPCMFDIMLHSLYIYDSN